MSQGLFDGLDETARDELHAQLRPRLLPADAVLCRAGDRSDSLYLVERGVLHVLDGLLLLFIVIELFRMSMALMKDQNVLLAALEMVVVALARKLVAVESSEDLMPKVVALALSSATWALIVWRTRAGPPPEGGRPQN